tara:strand:+ start:219 stop:521 length:303 start_codon:yes stop_codon:yes gene_type:complete
MSEDDTMPVETTAEESSDAPIAPQLGVNDLKLMANIIEVVSNRGAIKANEMAAVGSLYNVLMNFLVANGAVETPQADVSQDAPVGEDTVEEIADEGNTND